MVLDARSYLWEVAGQQQCEGLPYSRPYKRVHISALTGALSSAIVCEQRGTQACQ